MHAHELMCLIGALVGTLVGVLPGIGTIATVAMLLPITFGLPPVGALFGAFASVTDKSLVTAGDHMDAGATWCRSSRSLALG